MPPHTRNGLVLIGIGLLFMWLGLVWAANLFGVAAEHARQILASNKSRWRFIEVRMSFDRLVRNARIFGVVFMVFNLVWVVAGILEFTRGNG
jgi:hypothetical protein